MKESNLKSKIENAITEYDPDLFDAETKFKEVLNSSMFLDHEFTQELTLNSPEGVKFRYFKDDQGKQNFYQVTYEILKIEDTAEQKK